MKKTMILAAAALVAGSALAAEVLSVNAVGFIQTECPAGEYTALSYPFYGTDDDAGGTAWTNTPIAQDAAAGSTVYFWNTQTKNWDYGTLTKTARATNWAAAVRTKKILPGEMFLYKPNEDQAIMITGEVPDEGQLEVNINAAGDYSALGYPYPAEIAWTNTPIALNANGGDTVYFWNTQTKNWDYGTLTKTARATNWASSVRAKVVAPGEGFFFKAASGDATTASFERPYDWPAAADGE